MSKENIRISLIWIFFAGVLLAVAIWVFGKPFIYFGLAIAGIVLIFVVIEYRRQIFNPILRFLHSLLTYQRRLKYMPPSIAMQGYGIRRKLTSYEAALLMQQPLERVVAATINNLEARGALKLKSRQPLKLEIVRPFNNDLDEFEREFLRACQHRDRKKRSVTLAGLLAHRVKFVTQKMKGFSPVETVNFYRNDVENFLGDAGTPEALLLTKNLIGDIGSFSQVITQSTNPYPKAWQIKEMPRHLRRESFRSGGGDGWTEGGGSCDCASCACACDGCACACAGGGH
jgi:hypothetical protein